MLILCSCFSVDVSSASIRRSIPRSLFSISARFSKITLICILPMAAAPATENRIPPTVMISRRSIAPSITLFTPFAIRFGFADADHSPNDTQHGSCCGQPTRQGGSNDCQRRGIKTYFNFFVHGAVGHVTLPNTPLLSRVGLLLVEGRSLSATRYAFQASVRVRSLDARQSQS
jgi:hypothetical protein